MKWKMFLKLQCILALWLHMQHHIINEWANLFSTVIFVSLEWHQTKVSLLLHRVMQIQDSSMNITFIIHTPWLHLYSLLYSYLVAVSAGFHFIISLQVLFHSTNLKWVPCFCPFVLLWIFYFEIIFYFQFSILML